MGKNTVTIIGGGASGLLAGIVAARNGSQVTIIDRMNKLGKKILSTGNGKCNYTNIDMALEYFHSENIETCEKVLEQFDYKSTIDFFKEIGVFPRVERGSYVYPYSGQAISVVDNLLFEVKRLGIKVEQEEVIDIINDKDRFIISTNKKKYYSKKLIIATGGMSASKLGSNGSGYKLAEKLGHKLVKPLPALVQLRVKEKFIKQLKGVRAQGKVTLICNSKKIKEDIGEIQFTDYGLSGIPIFQLSRHASKYLDKGKKVVVKIDLMPELKGNELDKILIDRFGKMGNRTIADSLIGLFNNKLISVVLQICQLECNIKVSSISKEKREKLICTIKAMEFNISGTKDFESSQVTAGGISTDEVYSDTLMSKIHKNLYFAGEILDVDGDCGGYNLQWAWSSGFVSGVNASK